MLSRMIAVMIYGLLLTGCSTEVAYTDLHERDVNEMVALLQVQGISSQKRAVADSMYELHVDKADFASAINVLRAAGYPRERFKSMGEIFEKKGLLSSPMEERARYVFALSQSMSETISQIDGVITARVHLVVPDNNPFTENLKPSSASVLIRYDPEFDISLVTADIKMLVQKSIQGLEYDAITTVLFPARPFEKMPPAVRPPAPLSPANPWGLSSLGLVALGAGSLLCWHGYRRRRQQQSLVYGESRQ